MMSIKYYIRKSGTYDFLIINEDDDGATGVTETGVVYNEASGHYVFNVGALLQPGHWKVRVTYVGAGIQWHHHASIGQYFSAWHTNRPMLYGSTEYNYTAPFKLTFYDSDFAVE